MKSLLLFLLLLIGSYFFTFNNQLILTKEETHPNITVTVEGALKNPGIFELEEPTMDSLFNKIELEEDADCSCINTERLLLDQDIIYIPKTTQLKISLNEGSIEDLMTIKGIGQKKAEKIIEYRQEHPFTQIEQIMEISGIGYKTYLKWRPYLCL